MVFAASSSIRVSDDQHATSETLTLDDECHPTLSGAGPSGFTVTAPLGCSH
ncbi:MAG: hypothetical protein WDN04_05835 [Rhodospirillales bacterium]